MAHAQGAAPAGLPKGCAASCAGAVRYLALAEIDGNGQRDAVLDVRGVTYRRTDPQPRCGATACSIDVYPKLGTPARKLNGRTRVLPISNGISGGALGKVDCRVGSCEKIPYRKGGGLVALEGGQ